MHFLLQKERGEQSRAVRLDGFNYAFWLIPLSTKGKKEQTKLLEILWHFPTFLNNWGSELTQLNL